MHVLFASAIALFLLTCVLIGYGFLLYFDALKPPYAITLGHALPTYAQAMIYGIIVSIVGALMLLGHRTIKKDAAGLERGAAARHD